MFIRERTHLRGPWILSVNEMNVAFFFIAITSASQVVELLTDYRESLVNGGHLANAEFWVIPLWLA